MPILFTAYIAIPFIIVGGLALAADPDVARFLHKLCAQANILMGRFDKALVCYSMACVEVADFRRPEPQYHGGPVCFGQALGQATAKHCDVRHNATTLKALPLRC